MEIIKPEVSVRLLRMEDSTLAGSSQDPLVTTHDLRLLHETSAVLLQQPIAGAEAGDWAVAKQADGRELLLGRVTEGGHVSQLLPVDWRRSFAELVKSGNLDAALALAKRLLNPYAKSVELWGTAEEKRAAKEEPEKFGWGSFGARGVIGTIHPFLNHRTKQISFFRLVGTDEKSAYKPFPRGLHDNEHWEYLGQELPGMHEVLDALPFKTLRADGTGGAAGDVYVHWNKTFETIEYFYLDELNGSGLHGGTYEPVPTNRTHSRHWIYEGTDLPDPFEKHIEFYVFPKVLIR